MSVASRGTLRGGLDSYLSFPELVCADKRCGGRWGFSSCSRAAQHPYRGLLGLLVLFACRAEVLCDEGACDARARNGGAWDEWTVWGLLEATAAEEAVRVDGGEDSVVVAGARAQLALVSGAREQLAYSLE